MTLEEKINKIIDRYELGKMILPDNSSCKFIQAWNANENYKPWSIVYLTNPTEKSKSLLGVFLMVDMLIYKADTKECNKCTSNYIKCIKKSFMEKHDFKKEWLKRYETFKRIYSK